MPAMPAMPDLRALTLVVLAAATFACKGSEPKAEAKKAEPAAAKAEADEAGAEGDAAANAEDSQAAAEGDPPVEEGSGAETDTGEGETGESAPLPENFDEVGVDVCDQYVADYVACIADKVPEDQREGQRRIVFKNIEAWKQMQASGGPSAQQGLQIGCRSAREQAKRDTQSWACTW